MPGFIDKTGNRYGNLVVLERGENSKRNYVQFLCRCDCGVEKLIESGHLRAGENPHTISCGCVRYMYRYMCKLFHDDLTGKRFSKLVVVEEIPEKFSRSLGHLYKCKCDCGNVTEVRDNDLKNRSHSTRSCGCILTESSKRTIKFALEGAKNKPRPKMTKEEEKKRRQKYRDENRDVRNKRAREKYKEKMQTARELLKFK